MANTYRLSDGSRMAKSKIDQLVLKAKAAKIEQMLDEHGFIFCEEEGCGKNSSAGEPLDCSHDKSVKECQESGQTELAWDVDNITMRCRTCHAIRDKLNIQNSK